MISFYTRHILLKLSLTAILLNCSLGNLFGKVNLTSEVAVSNATHTPSGGCNFDFIVANNSPNIKAVYIGMIDSANRNSGQRPYYAYGTSSGFTLLDLGYSAPDTISSTICASPTSVTNFVRGNEATAVGSTTLGRAFCATSCSIGHHGYYNNQYVMAMINNSGTRTPCIWRLDSNVVSSTNFNLYTAGDPYGNFGAQGYMFGPKSIIPSVLNANYTTMAQCFREPTTTTYRNASSTIIQYNVFIHSNLAMVFEGYVHIPATNVSGSEATSPWYNLSNLSSPNYVSNVTNFYCNKWWWVYASTGLISGYIQSHHGWPVRCALAKTEPYAASSYKHIRALVTPYGNVDSGGWQANASPFLFKLYIQYYNATATTIMTKTRETVANCISGSTYRARLAADVATTTFEANGSSYVAAVCSDNSVWFFYTNSSGTSHLYCLEDVTTFTPSDMIKWYDVSIVADKWGKPYILAVGSDSNYQSIARLYYFSGNSSAYSSGTTTSFMGDTASSTPVCKSCLCKYDIAEILTLNRYHFATDDSGVKRPSRALIRYNSEYDPYTLHFMYVNTSGDLVYRSAPLPPSF